MAFQSRKPREPLKKVETPVWACTNEKCRGWMRAAYSFADEPRCPLCQSEMQKEWRWLPKLES